MEETGESDKPAVGPTVAGGFRGPLVPGVSSTGQRTVKGASAAAAGFAEEVLASALPEDSLEDISEDSWPLFESLGGNPPSPLMEDAASPMVSSPGASWPCASRLE